MIFWGKWWSTFLFDGNLIVQHYLYLQILVWLALDSPTPDGLVMIGVSCSYKPRQEAVECIYTFGIAWMYGSCRSLSNSRGCARRSAFKLVGMLHAPCGFFHNFPEGCTISECILDRLKLEHYRMFFWQHRPSTSMIFKGIFEIQVEVETTNSMKKVEPLPRIAQKWHEPSTIPGLFECCAMVSVTTFSPLRLLEAPCIQLQHFWAAHGCRTNAAAVSYLAVFLAVFLVWTVYQMSLGGIYIYIYIYRRSLSHSYDTLAI